MLYRACAVAMALGALAAAPCQALTVQSAPPRPDVALHLRSQAAPTSRIVPGPDELKDSFAASGRPQLGQGSYSPERGGTTRFSFGPLRGAVTMIPGYGAYWDGTSLRDSGNPLALTPPRR